MMHDDSISERELCQAADERPGATGGSSPGGASSSTGGVPPILDSRIELTGWGLVAFVAGVLFLVAGGLVAIISGIQNFGPSDPSGPPDTPETPPAAHTQI